MSFKEFAIYLDKLEETSSRLLLIDILSELFKTTQKDEIDKVIYLMQGRLAPFFAPVEIGMADQMVAQSIALAFKLTKEEVLIKYSKRGDLGLVAFDLVEPSRGKIDDLTISQVFAALYEIAHVSGEGSVELKIAKLRDLMLQMDAVSIKHLVRIPLGRTRLGIGDPTVLDGLALAKLGDRSKRKLLEGAYNRTSDLGLIGKTLFEGGLDQVEKLSIAVGNPIRSELCERLPTPEKVIEKMGVVNAQYKYDGFRVQIHKDGEKVSMYSRNLENMTQMFPELIEAVLKQVKADSVILDTEALSYQPESEEFLPFQETTKRRRKHNIDQVAKELPLKAFAFDILYLDGKSLLEMPLSRRLELLNSTIQGDETLAPSVSQVIDDPGALQLMLDDAISKGLEGVVVKKLESLYEAGGRNFNWVKLKRHSSGELKDTIDCVILGYIYGKGKRTEFGAGSLLVGVYDEKNDEFVSVTKIGTGLTDEEWRSIKERTSGLEMSHKPARVNSKIEPSVWLEPEIVIEVLADEITRSPVHTAGMVMDAGKVIEPGYALRFPRLLKFRDQDKRPEDATTVKELVELFNAQGKK